MLENKKIKNTTNEIIENFVRYFDWYSSTSKTVKCSNMIKYIKCVITSTSPPIQVCHSPCRCGFFSFLGVIGLLTKCSCLRENLFTSRLQLDWLLLGHHCWSQETSLWWCRTGRWMLMMLIDENWFLATGTGYRIQDDWWLGWYHWWWWWWVWQVLHL